MKIYAARHGQTEWNVLDKICGITDIPLTEKGIEQAEKLAKLACEKGDIDLIICSPLKRAQTTAAIVAEKVGCEIITDERLTEWNYGNFEGLHRSAEGFPQAKVEFGCPMGQSGEPLLKLAHRVYSLIDDVKRLYGGKNVLLICHGGVCRVIEAYFNSMTNDEFLHFFMGNCELREYMINEGSE